MLVRKHDPQTIMDAAMRKADLTIPELFGKDRPPRLVMARSAVTGAIKYLSLPQPSLMELATMTAPGRHHTSVCHRLNRFDRDWPPPLRQLWLEIVQEEAEGVPAPMHSVPMLIAQLERAVDDLRRTLCHANLCDGSGPTKGT
jgi:hypothetical protein